MTGFVEQSVPQAASTPVAVDEQVKLNLHDADNADIYLFTTATCPNCKIAVSLLDRAGIAYEKFLAEENRELTTDFGIRQAPTLVTVRGSEVEKYAGVANIKRFIAGEPAKG